jgi:hypothetical protein
VRNWSKLETKRSAFFSRALPDLDDGADLLALAVEDRVLVGQLDQLGLLADHEDRLLVERGPAAATACGAPPAGGTACGGGGGCCWTAAAAAAVRGGGLDVLGPALPVPPAGSAAAGGVGYQPGGGGGCVTAAKLAPPSPATHGCRGRVPDSAAVADLTTAEQRALDAVDETWLVDRLRRLVAVPSVGGTAAESEVQHLRRRRLDELGCDVDRWPIDLAEAATAPDAPGQEVERTEAWGVVGTLPGAEDGVPALVLSGHTDVVPAGDRALWPATRSTPASTAARCTAAAPAT